MTSKEVLEYLRTCKFCKIVMGTDYENDDRYPTIYDIFYEEIEIIEKDLERLEELEKDLIYINNQDFQTYKFPNGRILFGVDITNCPREKEKKKRILERMLKEVLENE